MTERHYAHIFDYLSAPETAAKPTGAVVFGRKDPLVARALIDHSGDDSIRWAVITGGTGKDSGGLQIPEAEYLAQEAEKYAAEKGTDTPPLFLETQATNGGENARNSLDVIRRGKLELGAHALIAVAHATSLRRLAHTLSHAADQRNAGLEHVYRIPSTYDFDPSKPADQEEAVAEMRRLMDWPAKGWLLPEAADDLPAELVDFVQETTK